MGFRLHEPTFALHVTPSWVPGTKECVDKPHPQWISRLFVVLFGGVRFLMAGFSWGLGCLGGYRLSAFWFSGACD